MTVVSGVRLLYRQGRLIEILGEGDLIGSALVVIIEVSGGLAGFPGFNDYAGLFKCPCRVLVAVAAGDKPAVAKQAVVGPVSGPGADGNAPIRPWKWRRPGT